MRRELWLPHLRGVGTWDGRHSLAAALIVTQETGTELGVLHPSTRRRLSGRSGWAACAAAAAAAWSGGGSSMGRPVQSALLHPATAITSESATPAPPPAASPPRNKRPRGLPPVHSSCLGVCLAAWAPRRANMSAAAAPRDPRSNPGRPSAGSRAAVAVAVFLALVLALNASTQWQNRGEPAPLHCWNARKGPLAAGVASIHLPSAMPSAGVPTRAATPTSGRHEAAAINTAAVNTQHMVVTPAAHPQYGCKRMLWMAGLQVCCRGGPGPWAREHAPA